MILVYNDSKERAILLATIVGGVSLGTNGVARLRNLHEVHSLLTEKLEKEGFLSTFFRGEPYVFIYTNGNAFALNKMSDYDPEYASMKKRPVPFFPERFEYRLTDESLTPKLENYKKMFVEANYIINAATDSITGELSFFSFQRAMGKTKKVLRVRPQIMDEASVLEAFNAPEESEPRQAYELACQLRERMEWVSSCNISNAVSINNMERKVLACGRLEALFLGCIVARERAVAAQLFGVVALLQVGNGCTVQAKFDIPAFPSKDAAVKFLKDTPKTAQVVDARLSEFPDSPQLHNVFTLQAEACAKHNLTLEQANQAAVGLFEQGYITWPTASQSIPWRIKALYTNAIAALAKQEQHSGKAMPRDVDNFSGWETAEDKSKHTGILVTEKSPTSITPIERQVYDIVAESNLAVIKPHPLRTVLTLTAKCGSSTIKAIAMPVEGPVSEFGHIQNGATVQIKKTSVAPYDDDAQNAYTEATLIRDMFQLWTHGFCDDASILSGVITNLIQWGHLARKSDGTLVSTDRGRLLEKYLSGSSLTDVAENMLWDQRLRLVAVGEANSKTVFDDIKEYTADVVSEIEDRVRLIKEMGGIAPSDCLCPACRQPIVIAERGWQCSSDPCTFVLPKEHRGHVITALDMGQLLTRRQTDIILDFKAGDKPAFAGRLVLNQRNQVELSFKSPYPCRKCGQALNEYIWGLKCQADGFSMSTVKNGVRLDPDTIRKLLAGERSKLITSFVNASNQKFGAYLYLDDQDKLKMEFPDTSKKAIKP